MDDWNRKPDEIYTNVILDKAAKQVLIVDRFTYRNTNIALIHIIQTKTRKFKSMGLPDGSGTWADVTDPTCLEPIANWLEGHRKVAFVVYGPFASKWRTLAQQGLLPVPKYFCGDFYPIKFKIISKLYYICKIFPFSPKM
ncbi:MAG: hypothetical protein HDS97_01855 [Bacteroidales bacterium]|nr:hypothetical protein [Bacteroidales bacterium]